MRQHHAATVTAIALRIGELSMVDDEALRAAFELAAEGTPAVGAKLVIEVGRAQATCRQCSERFHPTLSDFRCPKCDAVDAEIVGGREIDLVSLEVDE